MTTDPKSAEIAALIQAGHETAAYLESYRADAWVQIPNAGTLMHRMATIIEEQAAFAAMEYRRGLNESRLSSHAERDAYHEGYGDALKDLAPSAASGLVGWIQEHKDGRLSFYAGNIDPREIHDNGMPTYPVFRSHQAPVGEENPYLLAGEELERTIEARKK